MVVKTRRSRMSLRRSFRTRPSVQIPVIHVQHRDIELFDDISSASDVLLRSPVLRRPLIKRKVRPKVFATEHACSVISEVDNDHLNMEKLNAEHDMAEDFSLYIENRGGIRMKAVGNRLVKYDVYHGVKLGDNVVSAQKIPREASPDAAECKRERRLFRRAAWMYVRKMLKTQGRNAPNRTAEKEIGTNVGLRTVNRFSTSVQPIEETCEVEFMGTNLIPSVNLHKAMNVPGNVMISSLDTPATPQNRVFSFSGVQRGGRVTPKSGGSIFGKTLYFHSDKFLSFSPLTAVENVDELNSSAFPIPTCLPQAQSTPLTEEELQKVKMAAQNYGNENILQEQFVTTLLSGNEGKSAGDGPHSFGLSPRWNNVTMRTKSRIMHMRPRNSSNIGEPVSSSIFNNFANLTISILQPPVELDATQEEAETSIDGCGSICSGVLERSDSCDNGLTLAEEGELQCTNTENFMERNVTANMTVSNTYRSVSHLRNESFIDIPYYLNNYPHFGGTNTPLLQLLFIIEQAQVIEWRGLPKDVFDNPRKLGEGVYGEVFATKYNGQLTALKVIPFCGGDVFYKEKVNGEYLLDAAGVLPEILINRELSALSDLSQDFSTPNFIQLLKINVVKGLYPEEFLAAWDEYDNAYESENDRPSEYASEQQLFVAIGMAMGGVDLEHYQLANENQVLSVLFQIAISLVVAEERLEFEHRDLHVGNVLVVENDDNLEYRFSGGDMVLRSYGVKVHLIDFTLSRMSKEGTTVFRDLEDDEELFTGNGDYQFDIYRLMRNANQGDWLSFTPKSNCFWLHYLAVKLISQRRCKKAIPKKKRRELQKKWDHLLEFDSLRELFTHDDFLVDLQQHVIIKHPPPPPPPPSCE